MKTRSRSIPTSDAENAAVIFVSIELNKKSWLIGIHTPLADKIGLHKVEAGDSASLLALICRRLRRHNRRKAFWRRGLLFCARSNRLNRGHVEWIEGQLIELVTRAELYEMDNAVQPAPVDLYDTDLAYARSLLSQIREVLLLTGFIVLDGADDLQSQTKPHAASSTLTSEQSLDDDCCALLIELQKHEGWVPVPELATALGWRTRSNREGRIRARKAARMLDAGGLATMKRGNRSYELRFTG